MAAPILVVDLLTSQSAEDDGPDSWTRLLWNRQHNNQAIFQMLLLVACKRRTKARVRDYVERVMPLYIPDDFRERFRMSRSTFDQVIIHLTDTLAIGKKGGLMKVSVEKQLLIFLRYACTQQTLTELADNFGVCEATVHAIVHRTSTVISTEILPKLVKWPQGAKVQETVQTFMDHKNFPGIIGAIDGSHIPIKTPKVDAEQYFNRKKFPSFILQAVCDHNLHFLDVFCGWPGSVHDARVLKNSPLYDKITENRDELFPGNTHLIGDSAYPLKDWLLTPYKDFGNLTNDQKRYNFIHSSSRMCVERAFGALKGRFRRLKYIDMLDICEAVKLVLSCCTLHEICLVNSDEFEEYVNEGLLDNEEINDFRDFLPRAPSAEQKRQSIVNMLR